MDEKETKVATSSRKSGSQKQEKSEARKYLENVERMRDLIAHLTLENEEFEARKINLKAQDYSMDRVQTTPDGDPMKMVDYYCEKIHNNQMTIYECDRKCQQARQEIDSIKNHTHSELLYYHYIRGYNLLRVSEVMDKDYTWIRTLKGMALLSFQTEIIDVKRANGETIWI